MNKNRFEKIKKIPIELKNSAQSSEQSTTHQLPYSVEQVLLLPIIFFTTFYLFWIRVRYVPTGIPEDCFWFEANYMAGDFYLYFRMQTFTAITLVFAGFLLFFILAGYIKVIRHRVCIPIAVITVAVFFSWMFSEYKEFSSTGYRGQYETTLVLICYMFLLLYVIHAIRHEHQIKLVIHSFTIACILLGLWGVAQTFGYNICDLPTWLLFPPEMASTASVSNYTAGNACILFFNNQNYTSFFMNFPIWIFIVNCIRQDSMMKKCGYAALTGLMLYCLWNTKSLSGMAALIASLGIMLIISGLSNLKKWKKSLGLLLLAAMISIGTSLPALSGQLQGLNLFSHISIVEDVYAEETSSTEKVMASFASTTPLVFTEIDSIVTDGANVTFDFDGQEVIIATEDGQLQSVTGSDGLPLPADNGLLNVSTYMDTSIGSPCLQVQTAKYNWIFDSVDGELLFRTPSGHNIKLDKVKHLGFEGHEDFGSGRGYIWSRTLPLLKDTLLLGNGADTFVFAFPQDDYAGKYNYFGMSTIASKPHSMYLGYAVNTGVVSMLALIAIYGIYFIESVRIYRKREFDGYMDYIGIGIFLAVSGFAVAGLVNDSTVQVMPVAYTFLGMGFAINRAIRKNVQSNN